MHKSGVVGNNCLRVGLLSRVCMDASGRGAGSVTAVASNLDHNVPIVQKNTCVFEATAPPVDLIVRMEGWSFSTNCIFLNCKV